MGGGRRRCGRAGSLLPARFDAETDGELLRWVAQCVVAAGLDLHLAGEPRRALRGGVVLFLMTPHPGIGIIWTPHEALWWDPTRRYANERTVRRMTHGVADALDRMGVRRRRIRRPMRPSGDRLSAWHGDPTFISEAQA